MAFIGAPSPAKSSILTTIEPNRRQYLGNGEQTVFAIDYYENFVLVFQNGIKLTENLDYEISQDGKHVRFIVAPEMNDTIDLYGTIDIANTENRTIYSNSSFTTFTSLTDVDTLSATDNQVLTTDANGYFYFRDTTLNELTDVNPTVNFAQYLTGDANGYFFANTEFKNLVDLNPSVSPAQYLTGNANGYFFANTEFKNLVDVNPSLSPAQYLTGNANGYFFANTEFKNLVDVNPTANNGQILVADGSGNFSFEDQVTSLADFDMTSMADSSIDGSKLVDGSLTDTNFTDNTISGTKLADASVTEAKFSGTISGAKLAESSVPLSKLSGSVVGTGNLLQVQSASIDFVTINSSSWTVVVSVTITVQQGSTVFITTSGEQNAVGDGWHWQQIYRDNTALGTTVISVTRNSWNNSYCLNYFDVNVPAGTYVYSFKVRNGSNYMQYGEHSNPIIQVAEFKGS